MIPYLQHLSDRDLLEQIYLLLLRINTKVEEIDDDTKQFGMNLAADLVSNMLQDKYEGNGVSIKLDIQGR